MQKEKWIVVVNLATMFALAGCGGGNANSTSQPITTTPSATIITTGLVPAKLEIGASLYQNAATLRVLRNNAVLTYRGVDNSTQPATVYLNTIKQISAGLGMREESSNSYNNGPELGNEPVFLQDGSIKQSVSIQLVPNVKSVNFEMTELRSPVRINDQYTSFDRNIPDVGVDFDGDKINDAMDLAIWSQVIGEEVLDLASRRELKTVRVDTTMRTRALYSVTKKYSDIKDVVYRNWYAPGIGLVKTHVSAPKIAQPQVRSNITEELISWDGVSEGLGFLKPNNVVGPVGSALTGLALPFPIDAVGFDTHVVAMSYIPGETGASGVVLTQLGDRAQVIAARAYRYTELFPGSLWSSDPKLLRVGNELRLLAITNNGIAMASFDAAGQTRNVAASKLLVNEPLSSDYDRAGFHAEGGLDRLWLSWMPASISQPTGEHLTNLMFQTFDGNGGNLSVPYVLQSAVNPLAISRVKLAVSEKNLVVTWQTSVQKFKVFSANNSILLADKILSSPSHACLGATPVALNPGHAFICTSAPYIQSVQGARLNANFDLVGGAGNFENEIISPAWLSTFRGAEFYTGNLGSLIFGVVQHVQLWPEDDLVSRYISISEIAPSEGPLSTSNVKLIARVPYSEMTVKWAFPMSGRLLLVGVDSYSESGKMRAMVVWNR